jgi:hypothetical protein
MGRLVFEEDPMNRKIQKVVVLLILISAPPLLMAQTGATFTEVDGKVEVQASGSGPWVPAEVGMEISRNTMVATGFNARAALRMGDSTVRVAPLTRLQFEEIIQQPDAVETRLNLPVGRMSAEVRSSDGRSQNFQVRSPISTAAVRGTDFTYDGEQLTVAQGSVEVINNQTSQSQPVQAGQQSITIADEPPSTPAREAVSAAVTSAAPASSGSSEERESVSPGRITAPDTTAPPPPRATRGTVFVEVR